MEKWAKTQFANLIRYVPSGVYFVHAKVRGRLVRGSLKTKSLEIAKLKLDQRLETERSRIPESSGDWTFKQLADEYLAAVKADHRLKPRSKDYRDETVKIIRNTWPELDAMNPRKVTPHAVQDWSRRVLKQYSPTRYNGTIETFKAICRHGMESGAVHENPAAKIKRASIPLTPPVLPERAKFEKLLKRLDNVPRFKESAQLIRFLAFTGIRIGAARKVTPANLDLKRMEVIVPPHKRQDVPIRIPMIPRMRKLAKELLAEHSGDGPLFGVIDPGKLLENACEDVGIKRLTPHDLRHIFATRCLESGVDVRTIAEWLCHRDGGALLLKRYAHLRSEHSRKMARKVRF